MVVKNPVERGTLNIKLIYRDISFPDTCLNKTIKINHKLKMEVNTPLEQQLILL
jgi:hypothetical protein